MNQSFEFRNSLGKFFCVEWEGVCYPFADPIATVRINLFRKGKKFFDIPCVPIEERFNISPIPEEQEEQTSSLDFSPSENLRHFLFTGEVRPPQKGEWYFNVVAEGPMESQLNRQISARRILIPKLPELRSLPQGWKWEGKVRKPKKGEWFLFFGKVLEVSECFVERIEGEYPILYKN